jgi:hypothetical protein
MMREDIEQTEETLAAKSLYRSIFPRWRHLCFGVCIVDWSMTPTHFLSAKTEPSVNPSGAEETFRSAEELLFKNVRYGYKNHQNDVKLAT